MSDGWNARTDYDRERFDPGNEHELNDLHFREWQLKQLEALEREREALIKVRIVEVEE